MPAAASEPPRSPKTAQRLRYLQAYVAALDRAVSTPRPAAIRGRAATGNQSPIDPLRRYVGQSENEDPAVVLARRGCSSAAKEEEEDDSERS